MFQWYLYSTPSLRNKLESRRQLFQEIRKLYKLFLHQKRSLERPLKLGLQKRTELEEQSQKKRLLYWSEQLFRERRQFWGLLQFHGIPESYKWQTMNLLWYQINKKLLESLTEQKRKKHWKIQQHLSYPLQKRRKLKREYKIIKKQRIITRLSIFRKTV